MPSSSPTEAGYFWLEVLLFLAIPITLLSFESVRNNPERLYWAVPFVVAGFMVDRLNVSINALQTAMGTHYVPKWSELASSVLVIAAGVMAFRYAVIYLDILPKAAPKPVTPLDRKCRAGGPSLKVVMNRRKLSSCSRTKAPPRQLKPGWGTRIHVLNSLTTDHRQLITGHCSTA